MALLNRPLTAKEAKEFIDNPILAESSTFLSLMDEPSSCVVNYSAAKNHAVYTAPDRFYLRTGGGPSDCVWIVPGTTRRRMGLRKD